MDAQISQRNVLHIHQVDLEELSIAKGLRRFLFMDELCFLAENVNKSFVLPFPLLRKLKHLFDFLAKRALQAYNKVSLKDKELALVISNCSRVSFKVAHTRNNAVRITKVAALDIRNERERHVLLTVHEFFFVFIPICRQIDRLVLPIKKVRDVVVEFDSANFDHVNCICVIFLLIQYVTFQELQWL